MTSFFSRQPYYLEDAEGKVYPQRISSMIRSEQIAKYLGAKLNPTSGYENDVCVYVKPLRWWLLKEGDYVDVLDDVKLTESMKTRSDLNIIAMTNPHKEWLSTFLTSKITHIPHHHMNFERKRRTRKDVKVCGYVGANSRDHKRICAELKGRLAKEGIEFVSLFTFKTREDIIQFYESIDIQIIPMFGHLTNVPYYHEKKIVDAMSFGIPTISEQKLGYRDVDDFYFKVQSMDDLVQRVKDLQGGWGAVRLIRKAEEYHISNVAKLYTKL